MESALELISETGHPAALNIVRFHYKTAPDDLWSSDFNFSPLVLKKHWQAGYDDVHNALQRSNWLNETFDGIHPIIHEF